MTTFTSKFNSLPSKDQMIDKKLKIALSKYRSGNLPFQKMSKNTYEYKYLDLLCTVLDKGAPKASRPGQYTISYSDAFMQVDISGNKVPALSSRFVPLRSAFVEMLWFISGSTDVAYLKANNVNFWDEWVIPNTAVFEPSDKYVASEMLNYVRCKYPHLYKDWMNHKTSLGIARPEVTDVQDWFAKASPVGTPQIPSVRLTAGSIGDGAYGYQWRKREGIECVKKEEVESFLKKHGNYKIIAHTPDQQMAVVSAVYDQLGEVVKALRTNPDSRRIIIDAWDPARVKDCALPPCHPWIQFISSVNKKTGKRELTLRLTMRSSDYLLGAVSNIAQYSILAHMVAHVTNHQATKIIYTAGDCHVYEDQLPFVTEQLTNQVHDLWGDFEVSTKQTPEEIDEFNTNNTGVHGYAIQMTAGRVNYPVAV